MFREAQRLSRAALALVAAVSLALIGCGCNGSGDRQDLDDPQEPGDDTQPGSMKSRVKRKSPPLLATDLAQALDLPHTELCRELTIRDCFEAHHLLLGGVEPYELRIDEPLLPTVASPMAVDRIVLSACGARARRDFEDPDSAVMFIEVAGVEEPDDDARAAVVRRLYERLLARHATSAEIDALVDFHDELGPDAQPRDWAQLACFAVATTTEFLFY